MAEETFHKGRGKTESALGGVNIKVTLVKLGLWARRGGLSNWGCNILIVHWMWDVGQSQVEGWRWPSAPSYILAICHHVMIASLRLLSWNVAWMIRATLMCESTAWIGTDHLTSDLWKCVDTIAVLEVPLKLESESYMLKTDEVIAIKQVGTACTSVLHYLF